MTCSALHWNWPTRCGPASSRSRRDVLEDELLGAEASHDLDRLHVVIDVAATGISGYQAVDWLRENGQLDMGSVITAGWW